jgi:hypothetical protein
MSKPKPFSNCMNRRLILYASPELARIIAEHGASRRVMFSAWARECFIEFTGN